MDKKYVFITGATSGIGEACAYAFAEMGFPLVLIGRRNDKLEEVALKCLHINSSDVITKEVDVRDFTLVENTVNSLPEIVKQNIGVLINNAGLAVGRDTIDKGILDDWNRMIDTNIKGLLHVSKCIIPLLQNNNSGHIFNIASIAGKEVYLSGNVYCATKHAVDALSRSMRMDLVKNNIKVTNIAPGAVDTEFSLVRYKGDQEKADSTYKGFEPLIAKDVAEIIVFAATRPSHVNMNDIVIMPTAQASATVFNI